jgi:bifunctional non-homologous end joining protein LigD
MPATLVYFAFDLLHLEGEDLTRLPLLERKAKLETLLRRAPVDVRFSSHVIGNGARVYEEAAKQGLEGGISKAIDAPYRPGNRGIWVKTKALNRQEFVVVGWTDPEGSRPALGSLLLGYYDEDGKLIYAGRAGAGMTDSELHALVKKLRPLASEKMPLAAPPPKNTRGKPLVLSRVHWVKPELVAEITYLTWAADGLLRHVVYQGLREDKTARRSACRLGTRRPPLGYQAAVTCLIRPKVGGLYVSGIYRAQAKKLRT